MLSLLSSCTGLPTKTDSTSSAQSASAHRQHLASIAHIRNFSLEGRMGVQTDGRGVSGSMHWQHTDKGDNIALFSPMGSKMADVKTSDGNVTLTSNDGKTYQAANAETLTEQTLGWRLPVANLTDWVLGRPTPGDITLASWDDTGKLTKLTQDGWEIQYQEYKEVNALYLPSKLTLRNPKLYLKLVIERWNTTGQKPGLGQAAEQAQPEAATSPIAP